MGRKPMIAQAYDNNKIRRRFAPAKQSPKKTDQLGVARVRYYVPDPVKDSQMALIPRLY